VSAWVGLAVLLVFLGYCWAQTSAAKQAKQQAEAQQSPPPAGTEGGGEAPEGEAAGDDLGIPERKKPGARPKVVGAGWIKYKYQSDEPIGEEPEVGELRISEDGRLYIIKTGDCLWNLSGNFLNDPWRWREIWERNTYVTDPDLIYPGHKLYIGQYASAEAPALDSSYLNRPASFGGSTAGFLDEGMTVDQDSLELARKEQQELDLIKTIMKRKILSGELLAATPFLWSKKDIKGLIYPGNARIDPKVKQRPFQLFDEVPILVHGPGTHSVGDTVEIYRSERMLNFNKRRVNLVRRIGYAAIVTAKGKRLTGRIFKMWDVVKGGDRVARASSFRHFTVIDYIDPPSTITASVFERVEQTLFPYPYQSFIVDRGSSQGIQIGDLFAAFRADQTESPLATQVACAVHVGSDYATLATVKLYDNTLEPGDKVDLIRRMQEATN
jgi:hypothetical protein